uniref:CUB domain-containing protein n=1 Tax=Acrobeloides nanus TaxID=290746 RepID=A0A914E441_9BILA
MQECTVTVLVEDPEQIVQLTFTNVDDSFKVSILDGSTPVSPVLSNCYVSNGQQCYSTRNQVTIVFHGVLASLSTVQIFLQAMDRSLRPTDTPLLIGLILSTIFILVLFLGILGICYAGYRKRKRQKEIETMQACMIYNEPVWRSDDIIRAF